MSIDQKIAGDNAVIILSQEIDLDQSPILRNNIEQTLNQCKTVKVDLEKVNYIDSSGIAALVYGMTLAKKNSKTFSLINVSNEVMKVIKLAHLDKIFKIENQSGNNAGTAEVEKVEEAPTTVSSDNIDIISTEPTPSNESAPSDENVRPQINREDDSGDKIKFKR